MASDKDRSRERTAPIAAPALQEKSKARARRVSRGIALFLGAFALLNVASALLRQTGGAGLWWIDLSGAEKLLGTGGHAAVLALEAAAGALLVAWGARPALRWWRRIATSLLAAALAVAAFCDAAAFWQQLAWGRASALVPVPAALVVGLALAFVAVRAWTSHGKFDRAFGSHGIVGALVVAVVCVALYPLLQVATYGTTDYRATAGSGAGGDSAVCVVVPGARLADGGGLTPQLAARVDSGVRLVQRGGAGSRLVVSGGTEPGGANEAAAMASHAREKLGAGASDAPVTVVEDRQGTSLEAMVKSTLSLADDSGEILVTSSFYQLPRIKMLYLAAGADVRTVPAPVAGDLAASGTPTALAREVGAWWQAWLASYL